ncbi:MAG: glycerol-3-phosphate dehydrogenase [Synechocystis sp.]|nr:glycerol-3-phosphate dehydrogenase [Synechocystis sp.]
MRDFQPIQATAYDLVVIGGGINGVGTARDGALRGLKTLLIEKDDFASGTSSWSTRLIHGGLRYLEYFEFSLVRESLREREVLLKTAPHLVHPLQLTIPVYDWSSRAYWEIKAGMILYDIFSFDKTLPPHRMLRPREFQQLFRVAEKKGLQGGAQYFDGQVEYAERLALEVALSAQQAGATILNYVAVTRLEKEGNPGAITAIHCQDQLSDQTFTVDTRNAVVINTAGPWVDKVCALARQDHQPTSIVNGRKIGGTKGSHIVVDPFPGAPTVALYVEAFVDKRPYFIIPWLGKYLIGTTDHRYDGDLDSVKASNDEIDYLIAETNRVMPGAQLSRDDVRFTYSGVRPLPYSDGKKAGSITRNHILYDHAQDGVHNLISLIGGKLTTYRQVGQEMVDKVYQKRHQSAPPCLTLTQPLPGAEDCPLSLETAIAKYGDRVERQSIQHLYCVYSSRAIDVLALVDSAPDLGEKIVPNLPDIKAQVVFAVQAEMAHTLIDICRRRTAIAMVTNDYGFSTLTVVVETLTKHCGWTPEDGDRQIQQYHAYMEANCIPDYCLTDQPNKLITNQT